MDVVFIAVHRDLIISNWPTTVYGVSTLMNYSREDE